MQADSGPKKKKKVYTDIAMQGAIYNGVFGSPSPRAFTCPTSQCTWPDNSSYILLGVAGECENVTESVVNTCEYPMDSRSADCNITTPRLPSRVEKTTPKLDLPVHAVERNRLS
jgi:hypothetical protein